MDNPAQEKPFLDHLEEFRLVIIKIFVCLFILFPLTFWLSSPMVDFLIQTSCPADFTLKYFSPMEFFFVRVKIGLLAAFFIALPYVAYQIWRFVIPGLFRHERFWILRLALISWLLFLGGILFGYYVILPAVMRFSLSMQSALVEPAIGVSNFIGLATMLMFGFGVMFQFPVAIFILTVSGLIEVETLKKQRVIVLITILVLSAILTPPDVFSQLMMAAPTYLLFEIGLALGIIAVRRKPKPPQTPKPEQTPPQPDDSGQTEDIYRQTAASGRRKLRSRSGRRPGAR